jgi:hypothetical protein
VGAVLLGFLLVLWTGPWWSPGDSGADRAQQAAGQERTRHVARGDGTMSDRGQLGRCAEMYSAEAWSLWWAPPAMSQWEVHIGLMNKLAFGVITVEQAQEFWDRTRTGAAESLAAFADAQRLLEQTAARCPRPVGPMSDELRACAAVVEAGHHELQRAAVALHTWRTQVRHLEMLRHGEMTTEEAMQLWLEGWRERRSQVVAYRSAARLAQRVADAHRHPRGGADAPCAG